MAIPAQKIIRVGQPNQAQNSDSLYDAFTKTQENFTNLFNYASPYTNFAAQGEGIAIRATPTSGTVVIQNTGVTSVAAGAGITLSGSNGVVVISATNAGGEATGTVTSVNITSNTFTVTGSPITTAGTISIDIPSTVQYTSSTARTVLLSLLVPAPTGYEFLIKGIDPATGDMTIERLMVVASNGSCNYTRFGQVNSNEILGITDAVVLGTYLQVAVTPTTAAPLTWTVQYQKI